MFSKMRHLTLSLAEMDPTDIYFMEGFGLLEAMSAIEVCDAIVYSVLTHTAK